jgi:hypothetical protein
LANEQLSEQQKEAILKTQELIIEDTEKKLGRLKMLEEQLKAAELNL